MPTQNPIHLSTDGPFIPFPIPTRYSESLIDISVKVELLDEGWRYASYNSVILAGTDKWPTVTKDPKDVNLGYGAALDGKKLRMASRIDLFRDGAATNIPSRVKYTVILKAGAELLDEFSIESTQENPARFITNIQFTV